MVDYAYCSSECDRCFHPFFWYEYDGEIEKGTCPGCMSEIETHNEWEAMHFGDN